MVSLLAYDGSVYNSKRGLTPFAVIDTLTAAGMLLL